MINASLWICQCCDVRLLVTLWSDNLDTLRFCPNCGHEALFAGLYRERYKK